MFFSVLKDTPYGRRGVICTSHGYIHTPAFVFCGTYGSIKALPIYALQTPLLLCNAFHLRHHVHQIHLAGGIHNFIGWNGPIITDSGGYQVMSMGYGSVSNEIKGIRSRNSFMDKIQEDGCYFRDVKTGCEEFFNAQRSIDIQCKIGVDLAVSFDECTVSTKDYDYIKYSMHRSHRWSKISLDEFKLKKQSHQKLYGLVHGGTYEDLRFQSVKFNVDNDFDAFAIGGTLGKTTEEMYRVVAYTGELLRPAGRPVHLLGIGKKQDICHAVAHGVDTLDCVHPTRIARHGVAITRGHKLNLKALGYKYDYTPMVRGCLCTPCVTGCTRAYIHYLLSIGEMSAITMIVEHNIAMMNEWMKEIRDKIDSY